MNGVEVSEETPVAEPEASAKPKRYYVRVDSTHYVQKHKDDLFSYDAKDIVCIEGFLNDAVVHLNSVDSSPDYTEWKQDYNGGLVRSKRLPQSESYYVEVARWTSKKDATNRFYSCIEKMKNGQIKQFFIHIDQAGLDSDIEDRNLRTVLDSATDIINPIIVNEVALFCVRGSFNWRPDAIGVFSSVKLAKQKLAYLQRKAKGASFPRPRSKVTVFEDTLYDRLFKILSRMPGISSIVKEYRGRGRTRKNRYEFYTTLLEFCVFCIGKREMNKQVGKLVREFANYVKATPQVNDETKKFLDTATKLLSNAAGRSVTDSQKPA